MNAVTTKPIATPVDALREAFRLEGWNYRWSSDYGSPQLDLQSGEPGRTSLGITDAVLSEDRRIVRLEIPEMQPAMQMDLDWELDFEGVGTRSSFVHFTVHDLHSPSPLD